MLRTAQRGNKVQLDRVQVALKATWPYFAMWLVTSVAHALTATIARAQSPGAPVYGPAQSMRSPQVPGVDTSRFGGPIDLDRFDPARYSAAGDQLLFQSAPAVQIGSNQAQSDQVFEAGKLIAIIGNERILAGDMYRVVNPMLQPHKAKLSAKEYEEARQNYVRKALVAYVPTKCLSQWFLKEMIGNKSDKAKETKDKLRVKTTEVFFEKYIPMEMKKHDVQTLAELDQKWAESGSSVEYQKEQFAESALAGEVIRTNVPSKPEVDWSDIRAYYDAHVADWQKPARVKYRQLSVLIAKHRDRDEATQKIERMFIDVVYGGTPFKVVALRDSEGLHSNEGGVHDWTSQGSLRSERIDLALFSIPLGRISYIIEDDIGFHIVEVLEREAATTKSFEATQAEIKKKLSNTRGEQLEKEFMAKVRRATPIWTLWPEDIEGSRPLSEVVQSYVPVAQKP